VPEVKRAPHHFWTEEPRILTKALRHLSPSVTFDLQKFESRQSKYSFSSNDAGKANLPKIRGYECPAKPSWTCGRDASTRAVPAVWAYFNNDRSGYAIKNARALMRLLAKVK
jgi:uncharacterized protein YecE (DUF72 family)